MSGWVKHQSAATSPFMKFLCAVVFAGAISLCGCRSDEYGVQSVSTSRASDDGTVRVTVTAARNRVTVAESLQLIVEVDASQDVEVEIVRLESEADAFAVRDWQEIPTDVQDDRMVRRHEYKLSHLSAGVHSIPPITVRFHSAPIESAEGQASEGEPQELSTEPLEIEVLSLLEGEFDPADFRDVKSVASLRADRTWAWLLWVAGGIGAIAAIWAIVFLLRGRSVRQLHVSAPPPHEWALEQLRLLVDEQLIKQGMVKAFYYRLSEIVRTYIELQFGLMAPERTTQEFLEELRCSDRLSAAHKLRLGEFLEACDMVKYALHQPPTEEIDRVLAAAREFVKETTPVDGDAREQAA